MGYRTASIQSERFCFASLVVFIELIRKIKVNCLVSDFVYIAMSHSQFHCLISYNTNTTCCEVHYRLRKITAGCTTLNDIKINSIKSPFTTKLYETCIPAAGRWAGFCY